MVEFGYERDLLVCGVEDGGDEAEAVGAVAAVGEKVRGCDLCAGGGCEEGEKERCT